MDHSIDAIYENGVFRPVEPVNLPENVRVRIQAEVDPLPRDGEERLRRAAGSLADLPHWDDDLAEVYADRLRYSHRDETL